MSLLNTDVTVPNQIVGDQIQQYIQAIKFHDKVKFIPQRYFNINRLINVGQDINRMKGGIFVMI